MTFTTLIFLLTCIGLVFIYLTVGIKKNTASTKLNEENIFLCEKHIVANTKAIKQLTKHINDLDTKISNVKFDISFLNSDIKEKLYSLQERWKIISDERITSIPATDKQWFEARQIISQPMLKTWKPKDLSQSKGSTFNTNDEDAINQDFSEFNDADFNNIMDEKDIHYNDLKNQDNYST